jgi:MFS family permease
VGFAADYVGRRAIFNIICGSIGAAGFAILVASRNPHLSYAATFLTAIGVYSPVANVNTWIANNTEGVYKRGIVIALVVGFGSLNGIMSSNVYRNGPWYTVGHSIVLGYCMVLLVGMTIVYTWYLNRENRKRDLGGEALRNQILAGLTEDEEKELRDKHPDFRYTL